MSEYIKLAKDGSVKLMDDTSLRGMYRCNCFYRGKKKLWEILDNKTKEVFKTFDNEDDAQEFFYKENSINNTIAILRNGVIVEQGFKTEHLSKFIKEDPLLSPLFSVNCEGLSSSGDFKIQPTIHIDGENFSFNYEKTSAESMELGTHCHVYINGEKSFEYEFNYYFMDLIHVVFTGSPNLVKITKNGFKDYQDNEVHPFSNLFSYCEIDEDVTLGDFFKLVENNPLLCMFLKHYSWCGPIDEFHKAAKLPVRKFDAVKDEFYPEKLWHLRIYRWVESFGNKLDFSASFDGIGEVIDKSIYTPTTLPEYEKYGIELTPMNELVDLPLVLDSVVKIRGKKYHMGYTLLDILDTVYWEISFFGGPKEAASLRSDVMDQVAQLKEEFYNEQEDGSDI